MIENYNDFAKKIDSIQDVENLKEIRKCNSATYFRNEFWKQREVVLTSKSELSRERALAKAKWLQNFFGSTIPITRRINKFIAPHGLFGIFISMKATVGLNCIILQQVTIGSNTLPDSKNAGYPRIGSNVFIGAGAKIIGNVTVGDNCRIGANAVVTGNIPPNSVVVGNPMRIIERKEPPENKYFTVAEFEEAMNHRD